MLGKNLPLKVLSVLLAVFLWAVISRGSGGEMMEISLGVPLELHNLPQDMDVLQGPVERVDVRFSGPRRIVSRLSHQGITIPIDLTGAAEGETTFELFTSDIKVPERVTVTRVSPSNITVVLERIEIKRVPVMLQTDGIPDRNYVLGIPKVTPPSVDIKGPRSIVSSVDHLMTSPVSIQGATETIRGETSLVLPSSRLHPVNRSTVKFELPVSRRSDAH